MRHRYASLIVRHLPVYEKLTPPTWAQRALAFLWAMRTEHFSGAVAMATLAQLRREFCPFVGSDFWGKQWPNKH